MASSSTVIANGALTGALQYTAELASAPSFLLSVSFAFVAVVCLVKEVLPQCVGRYRQWRRQSVSMQLAPPRIVLFFACVCCSALVRSGWFLGLAITSPQLMDTSMPLWLFFGMWWVPEMFLTMAFMMLLYYWAKIYSGFRHLALFSRSSFRMKVHILEGVFTLCVWAGQFCIYILVVVMPEGSEASLRAQTADNIYLGLVAFFLSLLPISLYVILRYALQPRVQLPVLANDAVATKLGILTAFWAFGRFVRAIDAVGNLPGVWDWKVDVASNWIWLYLGPIYMFMEVIPEFLVITTTLRRDIMQHQQPEHRSQSARRPSERLGLLHQVRKRIDKKIEVEDLEFTSTVLGKGNFATVYLGYYNGDEVAIKSFDKRLHMDRAFFELFCHEVELMSELRHPNVVRFLGACISSREQIFLVTELVQRGTLRGIIDDETVQIDAPRIDAWIQQIANGMFYLHSLGLIHRDLKSENILVTEDMHLKVADFGVSRFTSLLDSEKERKTMTQQVGSLCWMAPEMLDPATKEYNAKVDVFSYGIILWEMVTRAKPYEEEMLEAIPMLVVGGRRPRIPPCEKRFADLMLSCWQANPDERPSFQDILSYLHTPSAIAVRRSVRHVQEEGVLEEGEGVVEGDDAGNAV